MPIFAHSFHNSPSASTIELRCSAKQALGIFCFSRSKIESGTVRKSVPQSKALNHDIRLTETFAARAIEHGMEQCIGPASILNPLLEPHGMWNLVLSSSSLTLLRFQFSLFFIVGRRRIYQYHGQRATGQSVLQAKNINKAKLLRKPKCMCAVGEYGPDDSQG